MRPKPIIGVPADRRVIEPHPFHMAGEKYLKAVTEAANAVPLIIPVLADDLEIDELVNLVAGGMLARLAGCKEVIVNSLVTGCEQQIFERDFQGVR